MPRLVGIDLGTTNSLVAVFEDGQSKVIPNSFGSLMTPSVVRFLPDGRAIVGEAAESARMQDPTHTVSGIKRFIGRYFSEVADLAELVPYPVVAGKDSLAVVRMFGRDWTPTEISALVLGELKESAEAYLGDKVEEAVITVPAYFTEAQRQATAAAGRLAGLIVKRLVPEPVAAALAYGWRVDPQMDRRLLVLDLGGGTYDVSMLEVGEDVIEVKAIDGDGHLGGDDFDDALLQWALGEIRRLHKVNLDQPEVLQRVREAVSTAKRTLSEVPFQLIELPFLFQRDGSWMNVRLGLARGDFESICDEHFERLLPPIQRVLTNSWTRKEKVAEILLVGGATRASRVSVMVKSFFGMEPSRRIHPEEAVVLGAAVQAGVLDGSCENMLLLDATPFSISIEIDDGGTLTLISQNTTIPTRKSETFTLRDGQTSVEVHVLRGSRWPAEDNPTLGRLYLEGLPEGTQGTSLIEVTVDIDANMSIWVSAKDMIGGQETKIPILVI